MIQKLFNEFLIIMKSLFFRFVYMQNTKLNNYDCEWITVNFDKVGLDF